MRMILVLLAAAAVMGCDRKPAEPDNVVAAAPQPAQISFDGASYKDDIAKVFHGERLSWVLGCKGCHGANLQV